MEVVDVKKLSFFFIIAGILIASYPKLSDMYSTYWQERLLEELEANNQQHEKTLENSYRQLNQVFEVEREVLTDIEEEINEEPEDDTEDRNKEPADTSNKLMGRIEIPKINLRLPILEGTSQASLKKAAGHLTGTNLPGEVGNAAIAAHRGHRYGRLFNRLDELEIGDSIIIQSNNSTYQYTVYEIKVVEPIDVSVLNRNSSDKILTLITCTPLYDATHRLIVHAKID